MKSDPRLLEAIAVTVEKVRQERKMTKTALANFADIQERYLRGIIKGQRNPSVSAVVAICGALGLTPMEFFERVYAEIKALDTADTP